MQYIVNQYKLFLYSEKNYIWVSWQIFTHFPIFGFVCLKGFAINYVFIMKSKIITNFQP